jgi:hypothetical protein
MTATEAGLDDKTETYFVQGGSAKSVAYSGESNRRFGGLTLEHVVEATVAPLMPLNTTAR